MVSAFLEMYWQVRQYRRFHMQIWKRLGIHDMGDALKRFAGVQVKDYGGVGGMKTVNIRGLGAGHTGVVYDGVQVGDCQKRTSRPISLYPR